MNTQEPGDAHAAGQDVGPTLRQRLSRDRDGYVAWVRLTDSALLALAVVFLGLLLLPYLTDLRGAAATAVTVGSRVIWAAFAVDYFTRLYLALDRREYVKRNILDLVIVVVPFLRPLRALRLLRLLRVVTLGALVQKRVTSLHARVTSYVATTALVVTVVAGIGVYEAERRASGGNIKTPVDGLWWAVTTMTTVGYGDRYPVTTEGRLIALGLMVVGIALLGVITASIAAWFVGRSREVAVSEDETHATLKHLLAEVGRVHNRLDALEARLTAVGEPDLELSERG